MTTGGSPPAVDVGRVRNDGYEHEDWPGNPKPGTRPPRTGIQPPPSGGLSWDGFYRGDDETSKNRMVLSHFDFEPGELAVIRRSDGSVSTEKIDRKLGKTHAYGLDRFLYAVTPHCLSTHRLIRMRPAFDLDAWRKRQEQLDTAGGRPRHGWQWLERTIQVMDGLILAYTEPDKDGDGVSLGMGYAVETANQVVRFIRQNPHYEPGDEDRGNRIGLWNYGWRRGWGWTGDEFFIPKHPPI